MNCPDCGGATGVLETAAYPDRVRRRRECVACGHRFTTDERPRTPSRFQPGDRVRSPGGSMGTVRKLANLQIGPGVTDDNPLYIVHFDDLGGMKDVDVKLTADRLNPEGGTR